MATADRLMVLVAYQSRMSKTLLNKSSGDLDGSDETVETTRGEEPHSTVFRLINTLDVSVDMTVAGTHGEDADHNHTEDLETVSVSSGASTKQFGGSRSTEEWERMELTLSFAANPSSGQVWVVQMGGE